MEQQMRCASNVSIRAIVQPQFAHIRAQLRFERRRYIRVCRTRGSTRIILLFFLLDSEPLFPRQNTLSHLIQTLTRAYLPYERGYILLGVVEYGLYDMLQRRLLGL